MVKLDTEHQTQDLLVPTARSLLFAIKDFFSLVRSFRPPLNVDYSGIVVELPDSRRITTTPEQTNVVLSSSSPGITRVVAHACTGKTTSMLGFAQEIAADGGQVKVVVRARCLRQELSTLFPGGRGVDETCTTFNALIKRGFDVEYGRAFARKWKSFSGEWLRRLNHDDILSLLGILDDGWEVENTSAGRVEQIDGKRIGPCFPSLHFRFSVSCLTYRCPNSRTSRALSLDRFIRSAEPRPTLYHVSFPDRQPVIEPEKLLSALEKL